MAKGIHYMKTITLCGHGTARRHKSQQFQSIQCIPDFNTALAVQSGFADVDQQNI